MDHYALETLDPDRFQQLCQALLIRENEDVQAFPVDHADGECDGLVCLAQGARALSDH